MPAKKVDFYADKNMGIPEAKEEDDDIAVKKAMKATFAKRLLQYPQLQLIVCKKGVRKCNHKESVDAEDEQEMVYIDGIDECEPALTLRMDGLKKGEYFILYRADFRKDHKNKRLNLVMYSEFQQIEDLQKKRKRILSASSSRSRTRGKDKHSHLLNKNTNQSQASLFSQQSKAMFEKAYDPSMATEWERLDKSSFGLKFFDRMEKINYARLVEGKKFKQPEFMD